jgi:TRAP-type transport system periplasmic protein
MKKLSVVLVVTLCVIVSAPLGAFAQAKPGEWRMHTPHGEGRAEFVMEKEWADAIAKETGGRIKPTWYPFNALGFKDADMLRVVPQGVIEGYMFYPGYIVRDDPVQAITSPEMILYQREHFVNFWPAVHEAAKQRLSSKWKIRLSATFPSPACNVGIIGKQPFRTLESMKGKKIRAWEMPQAETFKKLGIPTQMMAQSELYLALKSGVLDGAIYLTTPYLTASMYEVSSYWSTLYQGTQVLGAAISEAVFKALPADLQEAVQRAETNIMKKWAAEANGWCAKYDDAAFAELKKKGAQLLEPFSRADQDLLVKTAIEGWRERAKELGSEAVEYQKKMEEALVKAKPKS